MSLYGQIVIGAPGSGKTTYCHGLSSILQGIKRPYVFVNLDPANENIPYEPGIDINELITVEAVMEQFGLGPNGALKYCMQTLSSNLKWLEKRLKKFRSHYVIIDMPGQMELYTSDDSVRKIIEQFGKWNSRLCAVHLTDSIYIADPGKFISVVLSALTIMINLETPQINVLSKSDLIPKDAPFSPDYFELLPDLRYLVDLLEDHPVLKRYKKLNEELCGLIDDYNLVSFFSLDVQDKDKMISLLKQADNANGFSLATFDDFRNVIRKNDPHEPEK